MTETFRALKDKKLPVTVDVQRLLSQLQNNDIKVLSLSQHSSGVEVWLWCQTVQAVQRLQHMNSGNIQTTLKQLFRLLSSGVLNPRIVNIDAVQFTKDIGKLLSFKMLSVKFKLEFNPTATQIHKNCYTKFCFELL